VTLTLNFTTTYPSFSNGFIKLEIPKDCVTYNSTLPPVLTYGTLNTPLTASSVVYNSTYTIITIPNWCSGNIAATCPAGTAFKLNLSGGKNP